MSNLITYKLVNDHNGKLKPAIKLACDFWNRFILPKEPMVIRLEVFTDNSRSIARARRPYTYLNTLYGRIAFNTTYLDRYNDVRITSTLIHEIGHCLGIGWEKWLDLFDQQTGFFYQDAIDQVPELANMRVETDYGAGTTLSHWDEATFGREIMTGIKDYAEHVSPATLAVMPLLGHQVIERLNQQRPVSDILDELRGQTFTRHNDIISLDREHEEETDIWEELEFG